MAIRCRWLKSFRLERVTASLECRHKECLPVRIEGINFLFYRTDGALSKVTPYLMPCEAHTNELNLSLWCCGYESSVEKG